MTDSGHRDAGRLRGNGVWCGGGRCRVGLVLFAIFAASIAMAILLPGKGSETSRRKGPYLILNGDNTSMTVLWQLDGTATCTLEWGRDTSYGMGHVETTEHGSDHQHAHVIDGLVPGALYDYRVWMGGHPYTGSFRTPPNRAADHVKFMAYGDTRSYPWVHDQVASAMLARDPGYRTFLLVVGDLVSHGRREADWDEQLFDPTYTHIQELLASLPYQSCIGNHELKGDGDDLFLKYFPYRWISSHYGSFDYGPAHFTFVDQYVDYSPGSAQYAWIVSDLAATDRPWRFVVLHEPGFSAGGHGDNEEVQRDLEPLFERYGVAMVFAGHNHYYARAVAGGVQHITTGGGGAPLYDPDPGAPKVVAVGKTYHFCRIEIEGGRLSFQAVTADGTVIDSFQMVRSLVRGRPPRMLPSTGTEDHASAAGRDMPRPAGSTPAPIPRSPHTLPATGSPPPTPTLPRQQ
ncbi:MAG: metallophosphoesterase family protein [Acidobacteria bacterium]|nr:metallophosphoesterase family protein [Acidobacteriota bacterium]